MDTATARALLLTQHQEIRADLDRCQVLAHAVIAGSPLEQQLERALAKLRATFMDHNATETSLVGQLLHGSPDWGARLVDRMLDEHVAEHTAFWDKLAGAPLDVAARIDDLVEELEAHMAAEERTFLSPVVLREDVIARHRVV